jgi:hypothetical protein
VLEHFWELVLDLPGDDITRDEATRVFAYLEKNAAMAPQSAYVLHATIGGGAHSKENLRLIRRWMNFLKAQDYDFEQRDEFSHTPILSHLIVSGSKALAVIRLLLEFGVNIHETNCCGDNAIQVAMMSKFLSNEHPDILEKR